MKNGNINNKKQTINSIPHIHQIIMCVNVLVKKDDKYLVLKRSDKKIHAPGIVHPFGGKLDADEDPRSGALRELLEESGVNVKNLQMKAIVTEVIPQNPEEPTWMVFYFVGDYAHGTIIQTPEGETILLTKKELRQKSLFPSFARILDTLLSNKREVLFARFEYNERKEIIKEQMGLC